jgi:5-methylthioadenosine/S-adenosylhomocysteine deaminase
MNCDLLIKNSSLLSKDFEIIENQSIAIKDQKIVEIGSYEELNKKYVAKSVLEGKGKLVMPGLVDAHTHTCQQYLRGRVAEEYPMVWARILVPFESNLNEDDVYHGTQLSCLEMIKSGTTSYADAGGRHMHKVAEATIESGMRAALTFSTMDTGAFIPDTMKGSVEECIQNIETLYHDFQGQGDGRINVWFGLRQVLTSTPDLVRATVEKAKEYNTGIHAHLAEHRDEVSHCLQNYQLRPAEFLDSLGALGPNLLTAHNVLLSEKEIDLLAERQVKLVHCPRNNLNSHGFSKTPRILQQGISVGIGSDGAANSGLCLFDEIRVLKFAMSGIWGIPIFDPIVIPAKDLLKMITYGGANAIQHGDRLGTIEEGKIADLILIDIDQPHISPTHKLINTLVDAVNANDIKDVIINGELVMKDREVLTLDEEKILFESKSRLKEITQRAGI